MQLTDPSYISEQMFDKALQEKFLDNRDDASVFDQAVKLSQLMRRSQFRQQIIVDIMHATKESGSSSREQLAEIAFCMGLQFGFELGLSYPPLGG
jgi:hypothetical protein